MIAAWRWCRLRCARALPLSSILRWRNQAEVTPQRHLASVLPRIFEKGYSTKSRATNFGIGLHWCANALNALGGSIRVEGAGSTGATLQVLVPLRQAHAVPTVQAA